MTGGGGAYTAAMDSSGDFAYCREVLPAVSRTFALGIGMLRDPLRDEIGVAYLICRLLDTLEDTTGLPAPARAALLDRWAETFMDEAYWPALAADMERMFAAPALRGADHDLCRHASTVLRAFHALRPGARLAQSASIAEMARGMAATVRREMGGEGLRLRDEEDLKRYCYYVAGTVGKLLCNQWALDRPRTITPEVKAALDARAVSFGLGLQVTNIIKGVTDDIARGVAYVPQRLFDQAGITLDTLLHNPTDPRGRKVVAGLAELTLGWLDEALEYTLAIPAGEGDIRMFCALPLVFAVRTLARALRTTDVFSERVLKIGRDEVGAITSTLEASVGDAHELRRFYVLEKSAALAAIVAGRSMGRTRG